MNFSMQRNDLNCTSEISINGISFHSAYLAIVSLFRRHHLITSINKNSMICRNYILNDIPRDCDQTSILKKMQGDLKICRVQARFDQPTVSFRNNYGYLKNFPMRQGNCYYYTCWFELGFRPSKYRDHGSRESSHLFCFSGVQSDLILPHIPTPLKSRALINRSSIAWLNRRCASTTLMHQADRLEKQRTQQLRRLGGCYWGVAMDDNRYKVCVQKVNKVEPQRYIQNCELD